MNVILIGMRGSGKTTVSQLLGKKLGLPIIDTDKEIEKAEGMSIKEMVAQYGWDYFRNKETETLINLKHLSNCIIATGGGIVLKPENRHLLKNLGKVIYLYTTPDNSYKRIGEDPNRPILTTTSSMLKDLHNLFQERRYIYEEAADITIDTNVLNATEVVEKIYKAIHMDEIHEAPLQQSIDGNTKLFCIFGNPARHSLSPLIYNYAFAKLQMPFVYVAFDVNDVKKAVEAFRALHFQGASITIPHKIDVMQCLDEIDTLCKNIGACNTIKNDQGKLVGYNTDWYGAIKPLEEMFREDIKSKKVVLLGAGGAARAIAYGLEHKGIPFTILNRTVEKAQALAEQTHAQAFGSLQDFSKYQDCSIIINATSAGLEHTNEDVCPIDPSLINNNHTVFDIVYKPKETQLIQEAKKRGAQIIYGYKMLLYQAELQFNLLTGQTLPTQEIDALLVERLK